MQHETKSARFSFVCMGCWKHFLSFLFLRKFDLFLTGLKLVYNLTQPEGSRIESIKVRCRECEEPIYEDLDLEKYYRVVINSFLITGGDGYTIISENLINHRVGRVDIDVLVEYFALRSPVYQEIEGRITFVGTKSVEMKYQDAV